MKKILPLFTMSLVALLLFTGTSLAADPEQETRCQVEEVDLTPPDVKRKVEEIVANSTLIKVDDVEIINREEGVRILEATYLAVDNDTGIEWLVGITCNSNCSVGPGGDGCEGKGCAPDTNGSNCTKFSCEGSSCTGGNCSKHVSAIEP